MSKENLIIAIPNKGRLADNTIKFLDQCALKVRRENERQYQTKMKGIAEDEIQIVFQRARDIPKLVEDGGVDLGITGFDVFNEMGGDIGALDTIAVFPDKSREEDIEDKRTPFLPYGFCALVIAVPDHWVDITSMSDLADLALGRKKKGDTPLTVATEFPNLTEAHFRKWGIAYYRIKEVSGAAESAPKMGSADIVSDLKSSGVTLIENRLKEIMEGTILSSSACMIASKKRLSGKMYKGSTNEIGAIVKHKLSQAQQVIDRIEAHIKAENFCLVTANIVGRSEQDIINKFKGIGDDNIALLGEEGPTVASVISLKHAMSNEKIFSFSIQIAFKNLERVLKILRDKTGRDILISPISFVYDSTPEAFETLEKRLKDKSD